MIEGFDSAEPSVPDVLRLIGEFVFEGAKSRWLKFGVVDVQGDRSLQMTFRFRGAGRLRRPARTTTLGLWAFQADNGWPVVNSAVRVEFSPRDAPAQNDALSPLRALGADLISGLDTAEAAPTFTVTPSGYDTPITGSATTRGHLREIRLAGSKSGNLLYLAPGDRADADLLARPWPPIVSAQDADWGPDRSPEKRIADSAALPNWPTVIAHMNAELGKS